MNILIEHTPNEFLKLPLTLSHFIKTLPKYLLIVFKSSLDFPKHYWNVFKSFNTLWKTRISPSSAYYYSLKVLRTKISVFSDFKILFLKISQLPMCWEYIAYSYPQNFYNENYFYRQTYPTTTLLVLRNFRLYAYGRYLTSYLGILLEMCYLCIFVSLHFSR